MLSPASATVVAATLPAVRADAEKITGTFYERMFAAHPDLLNLFNRGNQANGAQRQALADAVVGYAEYLTTAGPAAGPAVGPAVGPATGSVGWGRVLERIAHKHVSLGIAPEQYTIVGRHLLAAVAEVLGDAVTPTVAAAWDEVYWLFACQLVALEARLYHTAGVDGPDRIWRTWRVVDRIDETDEVVTLVLAPADGRPAPGFVPGQYVSVAVDLDDGQGRQIRQYSLSGRPGAPTWQITVKRVPATPVSPAGEVSTHLHTRVPAGDTLRLGPPAGDVSSVPGDGPLLLVSAGIGVTPAMSALEHLAGTGADRRIVLVHADRADTAHPLRRRLPRLAGALPGLRIDLWYEHGQLAAPAVGGRARVSRGRVDPARIPLPDGADVHLCGPLPFMTLVRDGLLRRGVPAERIGYEVFGPGMLPV